MLIYIVFQSDMSKSSWLYLHFLLKNNKLLIIKYDVKFQNLQNLKHGLTEGELTVLARER